MRCSLRAFLLVLSWVPACRGPSSSSVSGPAVVAPVPAARPTLVPLPAPRPPTQIPVAVVLTPGAEVVDFAGPWGVFEYVYVDGYEGPAFRLYTVAERAEPLQVSGGLRVIPDYTFDDAPPPKIIVVPAQEGTTKAELEWLRRASIGADLTMSVCNGAFVLAEAGLLSGREATAHHGAYAVFAASYPDVRLRRGARFVDSGNIATAGGLTSGIDLALHVVARYYGPEVAEETARRLEYQGRGWTDPDSNVAFATRPTSTPEHPICPVCEMEVDEATALRATHAGQTHYFCSDGCRSMFERSPDRFTRSSTVGVR